MALALLARLAPRPATTWAGARALATEAAAKQRARPRLERPRDPEAPKRPQSAFFLFAQDFRKTSSLKGKEAAKASGVEWKTLLPQARAPYMEKSQAALALYREQRDTYVASGKKDAWTRDPAKPKVPMTGFLRFSQEFRKTRPELKMTEQTKAASAQWKSMTDAQKKPYDDAYREEKKRYGDAIEKYKASGQEAAWKTRVGITSIEAKKQDAAAKKVAAEQKKKETAKRRLAQKKAKAAIFAAKKKVAETKKKAAVAAKKKIAVAAKKKAAAKKAAAKKAAAKKTATIAAVKRKAATAAAANKKAAAKKAAAKKAAVAKSSTAAKSAAQAVKAAEKKMAAALKKLATVKKTTSKPKKASAAK